MSNCLPFEPRSILDPHFDVELPSVWGSNQDRVGIFISMSNCPQFEEIDFGFSFRCRIDLHLKHEPRSILDPHFDFELTSAWRSNQDQFWIFILMSNWLPFDVRSEIDFGSEFWSRTDLHLNFEQRSIFDLHFGFKKTLIWSSNRDRSWIFTSMSNWFQLEARTEINLDLHFDAELNLI